MVCFSFPILSFTFHLLIPLHLYYLKSSSKLTESFREYNDNNMGNIIKLLVNNLERNLENEVKDNEILNMTNIRICKAINNCCYRSSMIVKP
jgi:hypothetical protein